MGAVRAVIRGQPLQYLVWHLDAFRSPGVKGCSGGEKGYLREGDGRRPSIVGHLEHRLFDNSGPC